MAEISEAFVKHYSANVKLKVQQKGSKLRNTVEVEPNVVGEAVFMEQLGSDTATKRTTRHADTPITQPNHQRRKVTLYDYEVAKLLDEQDKLKTLIDPTSKYVLNGAFALGRSMDDEIIAAATATAYSGREGSTPVSFTAGNAIAHGSAGLTLAKILEAKEILDGNDVDEEEERFFLYSAKQGTNLLNTTEVKSADYNSVKALVNGQIDTFLGFKWILTNRLAVASSIRTCLAYAKSGIGLAIAQDMKTRVGERPDKSYAMQTYLSLGIGASRLEEEKVVSIGCSEA